MEFADLISCLYITCRLHIKLYNKLQLNKICKHRLDVEPFTEKFKVYYTSHLDETWNNFDTIFRSNPPRMWYMKKK